MKKSTKLTAKQKAAKKAAYKAVIVKKADQVKCSLGYAKLLVTIETLENKADKTQHEFARLANARLKVESKTISKVFKTLKDAYKADINASDNAKLLRADIIGILGRSKFPDFNAFVEPVKGLDKKYSVWKGLMMLKPFNKAAKQKTRAKRQDAKLAKAA
jgi:hypothetical protein